MAKLTLEPKAVLTARDDRPRSLKSLEKDWLRARRGLSSATTTQLRTHDRFKPRAWTNTHTLLMFAAITGSEENKWKDERVWDLQHFRLRAQAFGAQLHDRVGAEGVSDLVLTERAQPQRQWTLQLQRRNKDGLVTWVNTAAQTGSVQWHWHRLWFYRKTRSDFVKVTWRGTTGRSPCHSMGPDRWLFGVRSRAHTAALWSGTGYWWLRETSVRKSRQTHVRHLKCWLNNEHKQSVYFFNRRMRADRVTWHIISMKASDSQSSTQQNI